MNLKTHYPLLIPFPNNRVCRPRNFNRAKAYPAKAEVITWNAVTPKATKVELAKARRNRPRRQSS